MASSSHYDVLNVPSSAPLATIKEAYRILVKQYHPDKVHEVSVGGNNMEDIVRTTILEENLFLRIQAAWECLRDGDQRRRYDELLFQQQQSHQRQLERLRQKHQNAIPINFDECQSCCSSTIADIAVPTSPTDSSDLVKEQVVDWFYRCRCGCEMYVAQAYSPSSMDQNIKLFPYDTDENCHQPDSMIVQCIGCSLFYDISPLFTSDPELQGPRTEVFEQGFSNHKSFNTKKAKT